MKIGKIETKVTIPEVHSKHKYPWPEMEVEDSVFITAEEGEDLFNLKRKVGPAARYYGDVTGKKFKTLVMREENGVRIWRIGSRLRSRSSSATFQNSSAKKRRVRP